MGLEKLIVQKEDIQLATVVDVVIEKGVKILKDGDTEAKNIYYNSLVIPNVGDRVFYIGKGESLIIQGSLKF